MNKVYQFRRGHTPTSSETSPTRGVKAGVKTRRDDEELVAFGTTTTPRRTRLGFRPASSRVRKPSRLRKTSARWWKTASRPRAGLPRVSGWWSRPYVTTAPARRFLSLALGGANYSNPRKPRADMGHFVLGQL
jgi:hypothetical protein